MSRARSLWPLLILALTVGAGVYLQGQVNAANSASNDARVATAASIAQVRALKLANISSCESRNAARAENNAHVRVPLKNALDYLAELVKPGETNAKATKQQRAAAAAFVKRFQGYAALIVPQPPLQCTGS